MVRQVAAIYGKNHKVPVVHFSCRIEAHSYQQVVDSVKPDLFYFLVIPNRLPLKHKQSQLQTYEKI